MRHACTECRKKFRTEGALAMHDRAKHGGRSAIASVHLAHQSRPRKGLLGVYLASLFGCLTAVAIVAAALAATVNTNPSSDLGKAVHRAVARM
jgi:hypothetical protein